MAAKKTTPQVHIDARSPIHLSANRSGKAGQELSDFMWHMVAISDLLEDVRRIWAEGMGVSGPQWLILMAIGDAHGERSISVGEVADKIRVKSTFVSAETKSLEMAGLVRRTTSPVDARIVLLSLTEKARKEMEKLAERRKQLQESIFEGISERAVNETKKTLATLNRRIARAVQQLRTDRL